MIKLDFHGSTHGHFLEYVANVYIMQTTPSQVNIFKPPTYSAHAADNNYIDNRIIECGHYSTNSPDGISDNDNVIRIVFGSKNDNLFFVRVTNLAYKAGDVGFEKQMLAIPESVRQDPVAFRNNWYSKFIDRDLYINHYTVFKSLKQQPFEFDFDTFFSFDRFCAELNRLSIFLDQLFFPDTSLYNLWTEFISYNQGWQSYLKCNQLIQDIFSNKSTSIDCTVIEQGWLNYKLPTICRIYNGPMFEDKKYPANTQIIYNAIADHLARLR